MWRRCHLPYPPMVSLNGQTVRCSIQTLNQLPSDFSATDWCVMVTWRQFRFTLYVVADAVMT